MLKKVPMLKELKRKYDEDQTSRAFGALAEAYRKSGQIKKAINLIKLHIHEHPDYVLAYLTLAKCYQEIRKEEEAFELLTPIADLHKENLILQETYGDLCLSLGYFEKSMDYYKRVLFYKPKDTELHKKLLEIEESISPIKTRKNEEKMDVSKDWKQVDLSDSKESQISSGSFMSYFDKKMESFDSSILDNLSIEMIKESTVSDESLLTELTLANSFDSEDLSQSKKALETVLSPLSDIKKDKIVFDKVNTFLALLCSRREALNIRKAS